jgi:hypothetical protein
VVVTPYGHQLLVLRAWGFEVAQTESGGFESKSGLPPMVEEEKWFSAIRARAGEGAGEGAAEGAGEGTGEGRADEGER